MGLFHEMISTGRLPTRDELATNLEIETLTKYLNCTVKDNSDLTATNYMLYAEILLPADSNEVTEEIRNEAALYYLSAGLLGKEQAWENLVDLLKPLQHVSDSSSATDELHEILRFAMSKLNRFTQHEHKVDTLSYSRSSGDDIYDSENDEEEIKVSQTLSSRLDNAYKAYLIANRTLEKNTPETIEQHPRAILEKEVALNFLKIALNVTTEEEVIKRMKAREKDSRLTTKLHPTEPYSEHLKKHFTKRHLKARILNQLMSVDERHKEKDIELNTVFYKTPEERDPYRVVISNGLFYKYDKRKDEFNLFDTRTSISHSKPGYGAYIINAHYELYVFNHHNMVDRVAHSTIMNQADVIGAGEIEIEDGQLKTITSHSGHYRPTYENVRNVLGYFEQCGVDLSNGMVRLADDSVSGIAIYDENRYVAKYTMTDFMKATNKKVAHTLHDIFAFHLNEMKSIVSEANFPTAEFLYDPRVEFEIRGIRKQLKDIDLTEQGRGQRLQEAEARIIDLVTHYHKHLTRIAQILRETTTHPVQDILSTLMNTHVTRSTYQSLLPQFKEIAKTLSRLQLSLEEERTIQSRVMKHTLHDLSELIKNFTDNTFKREKLLDKISSIDTGEHPVTTHEIMKLNANIYNSLIPLSRNQFHDASAQLDRIEKDLTEEKSMPSIKGGVDQDMLILFEFLQQFLRKHEHGVNPLKNRATENIDFIVNRLRHHYAPLQWVTGEESEKIFENATRAVRDYLIENMTDFIKTMISKGYLIEDDEEKILKKLKNVKKGVQYIGLFLIEYLASIKQLVNTYLIKRSELSERIMDSYNKTHDIDMANKLYDLLLDLNPYTIDMKFLPWYGEILAEHHHLDHPKSWVETILNDSNARSFLLLKQLHLLSHSEKNRFFDTLASELPEQLPIIFNSMQSFIDLLSLYHGEHRYNYFSKHLAGLFKDIIDQDKFTVNDIATLSLSMPEENRFTFILKHVGMHLLDKLHTHHDVMKLVQTLPFERRAPLINSLLSQRVKEIYSDGQHINQFITLFDIEDRANNLKAHFSELLPILLEAPALFASILKELPPDDAKALLLSTSNQLTLITSRKALETLLAPFDHNIQHALLSLHKLLTIDEEKLKTLFDPNMTQYKSGDFFKYIPSLDSITAYLETKAAKSGLERFEILKKYVNEPQNHNEKFYKDLISEFGIDTFSFTLQTPKESRKLTK